ncbi:MAG: hypothetical protein HRU20_00120 [Pseudomonadales bacterium]|nr:hypothetical protein [Pseudomonadales bacterium]
MKQTLLNTDKLLADGLNEAQATWKLLSILRLITYISVIVLFVLGEWQQLHAMYKKH